jgi:outer membrane protein assembly factor BamD
MRIRSEWWLPLALGCALLVAAGCAAGAKKPDKITSELLTETKEVLSEKGKALIAKGKYDDGRKYLNHVFETYPNETVGREALLLVADSYLKQKGVKNYTEARYRYRDYLNRYPGAPRRDYARYQFALCSDNEHEKPDRDQTATREAIEQYRTLIREFPDSGYAGAARERVRQLNDLLAELRVGLDRRHLQSLARGQRLRPAPAARDEQRLLDLEEEIAALVRRGSVDAQADLHAGVEHLAHGGDARAQAEVRGGAVGHAHSMLREARQLVGTHMDAVRAPDIVCQPADVGEVLDRRAAVALAAELVLVGSLGQVGVQLQAESARERR